MAIRVYKNDEFVFDIDNPARLAGLVPLEEQDEFSLDADDLAAWRAEERLNAVRGEAQRRMMALLGARNAAHLEIKISNGSREAIRLLRKGEANWTQEAATSAAQLDQADQAVEAIRAASNALEAMDPVPKDYTDDKYWEGSL